MVALSKVLNLLLEPAVARFCTWEQCDPQSGLSQRWQWRVTSGVLLFH